MLLKLTAADGMSPEETREFIKGLLDEIETPKFVYRHKWLKNDLLIWDNRSALHQAFFDYDLSQERLLQRIIMCDTAVRPCNAVSGRRSGMLKSQTARSFYLIYYRGRYSPVLRRHLPHYSLHLDDRSHQLGF